LQLSGIPCWGPSAARRFTALGGTQYLCTWGNCYHLLWTPLPRPHDKHYQLQVPIALSSYLNWSLSRDKPYPRQLPGINNTTEQVGTRATAWFGAHEQWVWRNVPHMLYISEVCRLWQGVGATDLSGPSLPEPAESLESVGSGPQWSGESRDLCL